MSDRFCSHCNAEVEDTGGYCLLGHSLRSSAPTDSLTALRAEVNQAFEEARAQVATALGETQPTTSMGPPSPPPPLASVRTVLTIDQGVQAGPDPIADFAPAPRMDWGPEKQRLLKRRS